jgi:hypothetical protein
MSKKIEKELELLQEQTLFQVKVVREFTRIYGRKPTWEEFLKFEVRCRLHGSKASFHHNKD